MVCAILTAVDVDANAHAELSNVSSELVERLYITELVYFSL